MTTMERVLNHINEGLITQREALTLLAGLVTRENVGDIMALLPRDLAGELFQWSLEDSGSNGIVIGGNISDEAAKVISAKLESASQVIRDWVLSQPSSYASHANSKAS